MIGLEAAAAWTLTDRSWPIRLIVPLGSEAQAQHPSGETVTVAGPGEPRMFMPALAAGRRQRRPPSSASDEDFGCRHGHG